MTRRRAHRGVATPKGISATPTAVIGWLLCIRLFTGCWLFASLDGDAPLGDGGALRNDADAETESPCGDLTSVRAWEAFDTTESLGTQVRAFAGGAFDGHLVYLAPSNGPVVAAYDPSQPFATGWSTFDTSSLDPSPEFFQGALFDGRRVYFIPGYSAAGPGVVVSHDSTGSFSDASTWTSFDVSTLNAGAAGFVGATFDGRYVYFVPNQNSFHDEDGLVARYDTVAVLSDASAWSFFNESATEVGFAGGVFADPYVYFVPHNSGFPDGLVTRYDRQGTFGDNSSWDDVDISHLASDAGTATGFFGATFDGRYLYLAPDNNGDPDGLVARYDTRNAFSVAWTFFDLAKIDAKLAGFNGAAFDGRFIYFVPNDNGVSDGVLARYDTTGSFDSPPSWCEFDLTKVHSQATGFVGAVFDGQYLYFVPGQEGVVTRFRALATPQPPRQPSYGSFF